MHKKQWAKIENSFWLIEIIEIALKIIEQAIEELCKQIEIAALAHKEYEENCVIASKQAKWSVREWVKIACR